MLTPIPLPKAPDTSAGFLADTLASLATDPGGVSRDAALGAFRRHLARIQHHVQEAFEHEQITGLEAGRKLGALVDGLVTALHAHAAAGGRVLGKAHRDRDRRLRAGRAGAVQRHRPAVPHPRRAAAGDAQGGGVHAVLHVGSRAEGRPRHPLDRAMSRRGGEGRHDPHLAARRAADRRGQGPVRRVPQAVPPQLPGERRGRVHRRQAARARRAPSPFRRERLHGGAERQGGTRRPARPADALLARSLPVRHPNDGRARRSARRRRRPHHRDRGEACPPLLGVPVDRALPPALRRGPGGGAADLRPAAGGRRADGLHAARQAGRGGALHAPLFPHRARGHAR